MELKYIDGCTVTSLSVDGKEFNIDLSEDARRAVCATIVDKCSDSFLQEIFMQFLRYEGDSQGDDESGFLYHCDCCGDSVYGWKKIL